MKYDFFAFAWQGAQDLQIYFHTCHMGQEVNNGFCTNVTKWIAKWFGFCDAFYFEQLCTFTFEEELKKDPNLFLQKYA